MDRLALPAYVEAATAAEVALYARHGYRNAGQCSALQGGGEGPRWEGRQARAVP
jgi:hypothetical protein